MPRKHSLPGFDDEMIKINRIKRTIYVAISLLGLGVVLALIASGLLEKGKTEEELDPLLFLAAIGFNGFLLASAFLWLGEFVLRWKEGNDLGDRIMPLFWLIVTNIYGAYYFSYRRIRDCKTALKQHGYSKD